MKLPDQTKRIENTSKARIYVIRNDDVRHKAPVDVLDGSTLVGVTGPQGYLCWERKPGKALITSTCKGASRVELDVKAGTVYYLVQEVGPGRCYVSTSLQAIAEDQGRGALQNLKAPELAQPPELFGINVSTDISTRQSASSAAGRGAGFAGGGPVGFTITAPSPR